MPSAWLAAAILFQNQDNPFKLRDPNDKLQELQKFHKPDVKAMPMSVRLDAYDKRTQMLASSPFKNVMWRCAGPETQSGRVVDIAVPSSKPNSVYVAFATGGLWRTETEGQTWTSLFDNQSAFGIGDMDVTADGKTIYLGSGEANSQRTSYAGTGVFKSTDSGATWTNVGLHESHHIGRVVIDPKNPNTVYVAALGPLYSQGGERGLYKTTDGGRSWSCVLKGDERTGCFDVAIDPSNPQTVYATMWERDRRAWNMLESGPGSGLLKSTDGGKTWSKLPGVPTGVAMGRAALAVAPSQPKTVYVFIDNQAYDPATGEYDDFLESGTLTMARFRRLSADGVKKLDAKKLESFLRPLLPEGQKADEVAKKVISGDMDLKAVADLVLQRNPKAFDMDLNEAEVWRSDDAGKTWAKTRPDLGDHGGYYWTTAVVHPTNPDEVYTLGLLVLKSSDKGGSWSPVGTSMHVDHHAYWIDPNNPSRQLCGNDGGIYASYDSGKSWRHWNNLSVGQFTTIAVDDKPVYNIYGGLQDNGTMKGPNTYRPGISDPNQWTDIGGGDGSAIAVDPRNGGDIVFIASQFGSHLGMNQATNERWNARAGATKGKPVQRYNWISPILISPHHPDIVYLGSQRLHRSFNDGRAYADLSDDLTKDLPNGDVPFSTLTTISESPLRFGRLYVGADDGSVKTTPDGGMTWKDIATPASDRWVTRIVASKYAEGRVYCTQNGYRQDEWTPYVWVSEDFGATWTSISANLPFEPVNTIREDPTNENMLYVGTDMGVYVSLDRGKSWITLGSGIPHTPVHDLVIQPKAKDLVIASHARSVWVVNLDWLYKCDEKVRAKEWHSFNVDVPTGRDRWPFDRAQPYADGQPRDRSVTWSFWTTNSGPGKLELVDKDGKLVVSKALPVDFGLNLVSLGLLLKAGDPKAGPDPVKDANDPTEALKDRYAARRSDFVPKGKYKIRVSVGGKSFEQEVEVS